MAVFIHLTPQDMARICTMYNMGAYQTHVGVVAGHSHSTFRVSTTTGTFAVQVLKDTPTPSADWLFGIFRQLRQTPLPVPDLLYTKSGDICSTYHHLQVVVSRWMNGERLPAPRIDHSKQAGALLAKIHINSIGHSWQCPENTLWRTLPLSFRQLCDTYASNMRLFTPAVHNAMDTIKNLTQAAEHTQSQMNSNHLPTGLCHNHFAPYHVLFNDDWICGILSWWQTSRQPFVADLAFALNHWGFDDSTGDYLPPHAEAFLAGYEKIRPLESAELAALPLYLQTTALCEMYDRLFMYLHQSNNRQDKPWHSWLHRATRHGSLLHTPAAHHVA